MISRNVTNRKRACSNGAYCQRLDGEGVVLRMTGEVETGATEGVDARMETGEMGW